VQRYEVRKALGAIANARKEWTVARKQFDSQVDRLMTRLLNEAAVNKMSDAETAEALGVTRTRIRALMRDHGLNPKTGRNLLAQQAAVTLEENAALLGVEPHEFDLTSPLAYLPVGSNLRKFLETNRMDGDDLEALDAEPEIVCPVPGCNCDIDYRAANA
jgi:predicted XRE-type DNA-binding protein